MNFTCIMCPLGCSLVADKKPNGEIVVTGNNCPRGAEFAKSELTMPMRSVSSLVKIVGGGVAQVKFTKPIPKAKIFECQAELAKIELAKKPRFHQIVAKNIAGTGADVIVIAD